MENFKMTEIEEKQFHDVEELLWFIQNSIIKYDYHNNAFVKDTMSKIETCINICNAIGDEIYKVDSPYGILCTLNSKPDEIIYNLNHIKIDMIYIILHYNIFFNGFNKDSKDLFDKLASKTELPLKRIINEDRYKNVMSMINNSAFSLFSQIVNYGICSNAIMQYISDRNKGLVKKYGRSNEIYEGEKTAKLYAAILGDTLVLDVLKFENYMRICVNELKMVNLLDETDLKDSEKFNIYTEKAKRIIYERMYERDDINYYEIEKFLSLDLRYHKTFFKELKSKLLNNCTVTNYLKHAFLDL